MYCVGGISKVLGAQRKTHLAEIYKKRKGSIEIKPGVLVFYYMKFILIPKNLTCSNIPLDSRNANMKNMMSCPQEVKM